VKFRTRKDVYIEIANRLFRIGICASIISLILSISETMPIVNFIIYAFILTGQIEKLVIALNVLSDYRWVFDYNERDRIDDTYENSKK
jgi:hypothetical protein